MMTFMLPSLANSTHNAVMSLGITAIDQEEVLSHAFEFLVLGLSSTLQLFELGL